MILSVERIAIGQCGGRRQSYVRRAASTSESLGLKNDSRVVTEGE